MLRRMVLPQKVIQCWIIAALKMTLSILWWMQILTSPHLFIPHLYSPTLSSPLISILILILQLLFIPHLFFSPLFLPSFPMSSYRVWSIRTSYHGSSISLKWNLEEEPEINHYWVKRVHMLLLYRLTRY